MGRYALLVGISNYTHLKPLPSAVKDVDALRQVLINPQIGGFAESDVVVLMDVEKGAIEAAIYSLFANRKNDDLLLFYFSGHGVTDSRSDFYFTSLTTHKDALPPTAVPSEYVHRLMNQSRSKYQVVILDCCHSGAFSKGMTAKNVGTVQILPKLGGEGRAILTASDSTQYAFEQEGFELSLYTHFLVEGLKTGAADRDEDGQVSVDELYEYVRDKVKSVNDLMSPEIYPVREGHRIVLAKAIQNDKLKFRKEVEKVVIRNNGKVSAIARNLLARKWQELKIDSPEAEAIISEVLRPYLEYNKKIEEYEQTLLEAIAEEFPFSKAMQEDLREYELHLGLREQDILELIAKIIKPKEQAMIIAKQEQELTLDLGQGIILELVRIPTGKFMMGSDENDSEKPIHEVTVQSFLMGKYAVTNAQWFAVMGTEPSKKYDVKFQGNNQPVVGVSWHDCNKFCQELSARTVKEFRLPSEAEWEYACRANTTTPFHFGETITPALVNYDGNYPYGNAAKGEYRKKTVDVGSFSPNAWGLYQMHGNVWEWCLDEWHDNYNSKPQSLKDNGSEPWGEIKVDDNDNRSRLLRGGSWFNNARACRSAFRDFNVARLQDDDYGFRVVCRRP